MINSALAAMRDAGIAQSIIDSVADCGQHRKDLLEALRNVDRVLTATDPSKFSARDLQARISTARVLAAKAIHEATK